MCMHDKCLRGSRSKSQQTWKNKKLREVFHLNIITMCEKTKFRVYYTLCVGPEKCWVKLKISVKTVLNSTEISLKAAITKICWKKCLEIPLKDPQIFLTISFEIRKKNSQISLKRARPAIIQTHIHQINWWWNFFKTLISHDQWILLKKKT